MALNGWDVQVGTVRAVLGRAEFDTGELRAEEMVLKNAVTAAAESVNSPVIAQALAVCYEDYLSKLLLSGIIHAESAYTHTGEAVDHYVRGDAEMALTASTNAGSVPENAGELR